MAEKMQRKTPVTPKTVARAITSRGKKNADTVIPNRIKLLVSILNAGDEKRIAELMNDKYVALSYVTQGIGTARSNVLDYLGIGETEKSVVFALIPESEEKAILREIQTKMNLYLVGKGISFTIPLSAISEIVANGLMGATATKSIERSSLMTEWDRKYELIVAAVATGNVDEAMNAARSAGAVGGTVLRGRSLGNTKAEQFIGMSLQTEQELLLILANREQKLAIMNALSESVGLKTEAGGVLVSLPVDNTVGVGAAGSETDTKEQENANE